MPYDFNTVLATPYTDKVASPTQPNYGRRPDGTKKGRGWFGEIPMQDGSGRVMTELTGGFDGQDMPIVAPNLSPEDLNHLAKGKKPTKEILDKAYFHGRYRLDQGLSPYAD
jgi:hypothetical protein